MIKGLNPIPVERNTMNKSLNPISVKSRKLIMQALLLLMQEKEYEKITVTELAGKAKLVRKTFYRNFKSKDEVLEEFIEHLLQLYIRFLVSANEINQYEMIRTYFIFWKNYAAILKLMAKNNLLPLILKKYRELYPLLLEQFGSKTADDVIGDDIKDAYKNAYTLAGYWMLLCKWIERDFKETPEEMADFTAQFLS